MIYDNNTIEIDHVTLEDCEDLCKMKNVRIEINDGHIVKLVKE